MRVRGIVLVLAHEAGLDEPWLVVMATPSVGEMPLMPLTHSAITPGCGGRQAWERYHRLYIVHVSCMYMYIHVDMAMCA